jgi:hypothetical protein
MAKSSSADILGTHDYSQETSRQPAPAARRTKEAQLLDQWLGNVLDAPNLEDVEIPGKK